MFRPFSKICLLLHILFVINVASGQNVQFDYLNGRRLVEIPFEYRNNFIIVNARLNNVLELNFIFDTGAQHSLIFKKLYTDLLGAQYERRIKIIGSDLSQTLYANVTRKLLINVEDVVTFEKDLLVLEEDYFKLDEITGTRIDGLLGGETFKHFVVKINYRKRVITLIRKQDFRPPKSKYDQIPIEVTESKPFIRTKVGFPSGVQVAVKLLLDTGAGVPVLLYTNTHPDLKLPDKVIAGKLGKGLGGFLEGYLGRIQKISLGAADFNNIITSFQHLDSLSLTQNAQINRHGLVGNQILSRFELMIDYPGSLLYLKKDKSFDDDFNYDRSGLTILAVGHDLKDFLINSVLEGSPAELAGFQQGDKIKKIKGIPALFLTLSDITRILQKKSGKKIKITIDRQGKKIKKIIILQDLL